MSFFPDPAAVPKLDGVSKLGDLYGFVPRVFRLQEPIPGILDQQGRMLDALLGNEEWLSRKQKELVMLASSAANRSDYGIALHGKTLSLLGVSDAEISRIVAGGVPPGPDGDLVDFARATASDAARMGPEAVETMRAAGFEEEQIVEVAVLAGFCCFLNTLQAGTGAAPDFAPISVPLSGDKLHLAIPEPRPMAEGAQQEAAPEMLDDPDREWVLRVQRGDLDAFETLVERHSQKVYRTLAALLGNPDEAKDAMQDTFLKAFQSLRRFERRAKFSTWLLSIAGNTGLQRIRDRKNLESLDESSDSNEFRPQQIRAWGDNPEQMYSKAQRRALVEQAIGRLPAKYRAVLVLRDVQQVSTDDAAAALGLGIPALKARLLRGRLMLREALAPHFMQGAQNA